MTSKVRFAVLGMGNMGLEHVKNILMSPKASIRWLVRNKLQDAQRFTQEYSLSAQCTTPDKLETALDDPEVNAVLVCSPASSHEQQIKQSLEAGKAVFCEKPVTPEYSTTKACYELAESRGLPLFCAFHRRFDPSLQKVHRQIREGTYGSLRIVKATSRDVHPPPLSYIKTSGGIFNDSTIHDLDLSNWLVDSKPRTVFAYGQAFDPEISKCNDRDQVFVLVKFENGVLSMVDNGRVGPYGYDNRLEVLCNSGMMSVDNRQTDLLTRHGEGTTSVPRIDNTFLTRYADAYRNELDHFINAVQGKEDLLVKKEDTLRAMRLVQCCNQSIKEGRPIEFPE